MQKEKFSIRKTTVGAVSARIAVIGLLSLMGLAQEVKADEFVTTSAEVVEAETTATPETVTPEQVEQARQDLALAQATVAQDQNAVEQALTTEQVAKENLTLAQEQVQTSQDFLNQASPEAIAQAEQTVATEQNQLAQLTEATEQKESQATAQDKKATEAEKEARAKEDDLKKAEEELAQAEQSVEQLKDDLAKNIVKEAEDTLSKANESVGAALTNLEKANQELIAAKEADENRQQALEEARNQLQKAVEAQKVSETDKNKASEEVTKAQTTLTDAQVALSNATEGRAKIVLTERYIDALLLRGEFSDKKYLHTETVTYGTNNQYSYTTEIDFVQKVYPQGYDKQIVTDITGIEKDFPEENHGKTWVYQTEYYDELGLNEYDRYRIQVLLEESEKIASLSSYTPSEADTNRWIDINNMTDDQWQEINEFALDIYNQLMVQAGFSEAEMTSSMLDYVKRHAARNISDDWSAFWGHHDLSLSESQYASTMRSRYTRASENHTAGSIEDLDKMQALADDLGLTLNEESSNPSGKMVGGLVQMSTLKSKIYDSFFGFLGNKGNPEWRHAKTLMTDLSATDSNGEVAKGTFGISVNKTSDDFSGLTSYFSINHLYSKPLVYVYERQGETRYATESYVNGEVQPFDEGQLTKVREMIIPTNMVDISELTTKVAEAKTLLENATELENEAIASLEQATFDVTKATDYLKTLENSESLTQSADDKLKEAELVLKESQNNLAQAQEALEKAKELEATRLELLEQARQTLTDKQTVVDDLKPLAEKAEKVASAERALADSLAKELKTLEEALLTAQEQLATSRQVLANLQNAEVNAELAQAELERAELAYETASNRLTEVLAGLENSRQVRDGKQVYLDYLTALLAKQTAFAIPDYAPEEEALPEYVFDPADFLDVLEPSQEEVSDKESSNQAGGSADRPVLTATATSPTYSCVARATAEKSLPNTGDSSALLSLAGFGLTTLGLVGRKRRRV